MRIHVLGANGMLGNYVYTYLKDLYDCVPYTRKDIDAEHFYSQWPMAAHAV